MYACNGVLFNHESERRGETFVTRKITRSLARIAMGLEKCLYLGNLDALRDWGHARDYVEMQWLMLQQEIAQDFVIATGRQESVRGFVDQSAARLGVGLDWSGSGATEIATVACIANDELRVSVGDVIVKVDPRYLRPAEVETLLGDPSFAKQQLGWEPTTKLAAMIAEMVDYDYQEASKERKLLDAGYSVSSSHE